MSLRIVPAAGHSSTHASANHSAPSAPGIHDTLRASLNPLPTTTATSTPNSGPAPLQSAHPLEARLAAWRSTQQTLKHALLRREFGLSAPLQREIELLTVAHGDMARPSILGGGSGAASVHEDVLTGRDCECSWEDVFRGGEMGPQPDFHTEMEHRLGMNW